MLFVSPFLFWPIARFVMARRDSVPGLGFARIAFVISSLGIVAVAFTTLMLFHWNLVAYAAMLPFLACFMRPRWLLPAQAAYGVLFAGLAFVNYAITPLTAVRDWRDEATAWSYGWAPTAAARRAAAEASMRSASSPRPTTPPPRCSALPCTTATWSASRRAPTQFDYWFDAEAHAGEDAILFGDRWRPLPKSLIAQFELGRAAREP